MNKRQVYDSDLSDAECQTIAPLLPPPVRRRRKPKYQRREVLNAIFDLLRTDCQWRMLPHDLPHWQMPYVYFAKWSKVCTFERINLALGREARLPEGCEPEPPATIIMDIGDR